MMTEKPVTDDLEQLLKAVNAYLDALYFGDTELFERVMHPHVRLFSATDAQMLELDLPAYLEIVRNRPSPASKHDPRLDRVLSVEIASPTTAHVRVEDAVLPKRFTDELTFVRTDGEWKIVSKVWHYVLDQRPQ